MMDIQFFLALILVSVTNKDFFEVIICIPSNIGVFGCKNLELLSAGW